MHAEIERPLGIVGVKRKAAKRMSTTQTVKMFLPAPNTNPEPKQPQIYQKAVDLRPAPRNQC